MLASNEQRAQALATWNAGEQTGKPTLLLLWGPNGCFLRPLLSGGRLMATPLLLSTNRVRRWGGSYVVTLSREVRAALGISDGETIAFRKVGRYVFLTVVRAFAVAPVTEEEIKQARQALGV